MTTTERIDAAIDERPHTWFNNDQGEREGRTKDITQWFFDHEQTILEALRFQKAALGEPSDGMLSAGAKAWIQDPARKSSTLFKAMIAELAKQVRENEE